MGRSTVANCQSLGFFFKPKSDIGDAGLFPVKPAFEWIVFTVSNMQEYGNLVVPTISDILNTL